MEELEKNTISLILENQRKNIKRSNKSHNEKTNEQTPAR